MPPEAGDDTATRQGDGLTEYDGTGQPAMIGMEVERSTDETGGADRDAGATAASLTDTTATSVGVVGMEVERPTDGAVGLGRDATGVTTMGSTDTTATSDGMDVTITDGTGGKKKKKWKNPNRKKGGTAQPRRRDR